MNLDYGQPDRVILERIKKIDPDLSVALVEVPMGGCRWAVFYRLQTPENPEQAITELAKELQRLRAEQGFIESFDACVEVAREAVIDHQLVCYVTNDDGTYRPLDDRVVKKLQEMDYYRKSLGLSDWKKIMDMKAEAMRKRREQAEDSIWGSLKRDRVLRNMLNDILWGIKPVRSVTGGFDEAGERCAGDVGDSGTGESAADFGSD